MVSGGSNLPFLFNFSKGSAPSSTYMSQVENQCTSSPWYFVELHMGRYIAQYIKGISIAAF